MHDRAIIALGWLYLYSKVTLVHHRKATLFMGPSSRCMKGSLSSPWKGHYPPHGKGVLPMAGPSSQSVCPPARRVPASGSHGSFIAEDYSNKARLQLHRPQHGHRWLATLYIACVGGCVRARRATIRKYSNAGISVVIQLR